MSLRCLSIPLVLVTATRDPCPAGAPATGIDECTKQLSRALKKSLQKTGGDYKYVHCRTDVLLMPTTGSTETLLKDHSQGDVLGTRSAPKRASYFCAWPKPDMHQFIFRTYCLTSICIFSVFIIPYISPPCPQSLLLLMPTGPVIPNLTLILSL